MRIIFVRSTPLQNDSRSSKMLNEYRSRDFIVTPLIWSRGRDIISSFDDIIYKSRGAYGSRYKSIFSRLGWMIFIARILITRRSKYEIIHAVDLDTAIIAVPIGKILGKIIIYDAFDNISAILGKDIISDFLFYIEKVWIKMSSIAIFPDNIRLKQYHMSNVSNVSVISNIPSEFSFEKDKSTLPEDTKFKKQLTLVYIGTLEAHHRGLEFISEICRQFPEKIKFIVGGVGELNEYFSQSADILPNLEYIGRQDYETALALMASSDCLYGPYLLTAPAHEYASPNKMYEHLMLGKPLLTNDGTPPGHLVKELDSGFTFDGTIKDLTSLIARIDFQICRDAGHRASISWREHYSKLRAIQLSDFFERLGQALRRNGMQSPG